MGNKRRNFGGGTRGWSGTDKRGDGDGGGGSDVDITSGKWSRSKSSGWASGRSGGRSDGSVKINGTLFGIARKISSFD